MGILIWTGDLFRLNNEVNQWMSDLGINFFNEV
jgi:hypothetical protein